MKILSLKNSLALAALFACVSLSSCKNDRNEKKELAPGEETSEAADSADTTKPLLRKNPEDGTDSGV
jgi:hypothetical protein